MKKLILSLSLAGSCLSLFAAGAMADESVSRATPTDHQMMRDCIRKQKSADVTMSKSQMARICKDELRRQKATGATSPPPVDAPREP